MELCQESIDFYHASKERLLQNTAYEDDRILVGLAENGANLVEIVSALTKPRETWGEKTGGLFDMTQLRPKLKERKQPLAEVMAKNIRTAFNTLLNLEPLFMEMDLVTCKEANQDLAQMKRHLAKIKKLYLDKLTGGYCDLIAFKEALPKLKENTPAEMAFPGGCPSELDYVTSLMIHNPPFAVRRAMKSTRNNRWNIPRGVYTECCNILLKELNRVNIKGQKAYKYILSLLQANYPDDWKTKNHDHVRSL